MTALIAAVILFLDQLSKLLVSRFLSLNESVPVVPGVFHVTLVHNTGAAFGLFKGGVAMCIVTSLIVIAVLVAMLASRACRPWALTVAFSLILGGAAGNLIDRALWGHVVDFIDLRVWPVFNVADSAITVGALIACWQYYRGDKKCTPKSAG